MLRNNLSRWGLGWFVTQRQLILYNFPIFYTYIQLLSLVAECYHLTSATLRSSYSSCILGHCNLITEISTLFWFKEKSDHGNIQGCLESLYKFISLSIDAKYAFSTLLGGWACRKWQILANIPTFLNLWIPFYTFNQASLAFLILS